MSIDSFESPSSVPTQPQHQLPAGAAPSVEHALSNAARAENLGHLAAMAGDASPAQQAEHIRAVAALNLARLPDDATPATHAQSARWQAWALGLADGLELAAAA